MSLQMRQWVCDRLVFQNESQRSDLMDPNLTQTELIGLLQRILEKGHHFEVTAVRSDHHDDSALGEHCHANGWCIDGWPIINNQPGDYIDGITDAFQNFLRDCASAPFLYQIGLGGEAADFAANFAAAGPTAFQDDGGDHVHLGSH